MTAKNKIAPWVRLGDYITQRREKNSGLSLPIRGVTSDGFIPPKQLDANTMLYNVFYKKILCIQSSTNGVKFNSLEYRL